MSETTKIFADRLSDLINESGKKVRDLAEEIGISSGSLSKYQNDAAAASIDALEKISEYFGVSADWLLGKSVVRSIPGEVSQVCNYLGLSEDAVQVLVELRDSPLGYRSGVADYILTCSRFFKDTIEYLSSCAWSSVEESCVGYAPPSQEAIAEVKKRLMDEGETEDLIDADIMSLISTPILNLGEELHESIMFSQVIKSLTRLYGNFKEVWAEDKDFVDAVVQEYVDSYQPTKGQARISR